MYAQTAPEVRYGEDLMGRTSGILYKQQSGSNAKNVLCNMEPLFPRGKRSVWCCHAEGDIRCIVICINMDIPIVLKFSGVTMLGYMVNNEKNTKPLEQ